MMLRFLRCIRTLQIQSLHNPFRRPYSKTDPTTSLQQYLQNSFGLSPEKALAASRCVNHKNPRNPDSTVTFFSSHGFSKTQIESIVSRVPWVLFLSAESILRPKIQFFKEKGLSESAIVSLIALNPYILMGSLENHIKPLFDFLRSLFGTDELVIEFLKRSKLQINLVRFVRSVTVMKSWGFPDSRISSLLMKKPRMLALCPDKLNEKMKIVKEMGFDPSTHKFVVAVRAMMGLSSSMWDMKLEVYRSLGWSNEQIFAAFRRHPVHMMISEEKIREGMNFFEKELGWGPPYISAYPIVLLLSLEKRVLPRHRLLKVLASKGLINMDKISVRSFVINEKLFLKKYVIKYQTNFPDILKVYQGMVRSKGPDIKDGEE